MKDKTTIGNAETSHAIDLVIRNRCTKKVLADGDLAPILDDDSILAFDSSVKECIDVSGWAPFHYDRRTDGVAEPWRYALFFNRACREIGENFDDWFDNVKPSNKLPKMLKACGALILVNWLPESEEGNDKIVQVNEEHLAAASAATQNLILALEARGFGTYWSSGGVLGSKTLYSRYGIHPESRLIAAVFVNYPGLYPEGSCEVIPGKNREKRSDWTRWTTVIE